MKHALKMKLVPQEDEEDEKTFLMTGAGLTPSFQVNPPPPADPVLQQLSELDQRMKAILDKTGVDLSTKLNAYYQTLLKYARYHRQYRQKQKAPPAPIYNPKVEPKEELLPTPRKVKRKPPRKKKYPKPITSEEGEEWVAPALPPGSPVHSISLSSQSSSPAHLDTLSVRPDPVDVIRRRRSAQRFFTVPTAPPSDRPSFLEHNALRTRRRVYPKPTPSTPTRWTTWRPSKKK